MNKIITIEQAIKISKKIKAAKKTIVIVGGFFDILHSGHIKFLESSKKLGDYLFVLLEDDDKAKKTKGENRPINSQANRATVLSVLESIDYVVLLNNMTNDSKYDGIITQIKPDIIATTNGDPHINHKKRQAKMVNGKVISVIQRVDDQSTTKLAKLI